MHQRACLGWRKVPHAGVSYELVSERVCVATWISRVEDRLPHIPETPYAIARSVSAETPASSRRPVQPMSRPLTVSVTSMLPRVALEYGHT